MQKTRRRSQRGGLPDHRRPPPSLHHYPSYRNLRMGQTKTIIWNAQHVSKPFWRSTRLHRFRLRRRTKAAPKRDADRPGFKKKPTRSSGRLLLTKWRVRTRTNLGGKTMIQTVIMLYLSSFPKRTSKTLSSPRPQICDILSLNFREIIKEIKEL